ncbi:hypothetical protein A3D00_02300 [Candidatus Woesebacteria bacterium RIFCSPHIGHO2_02_FULL_38_9]|uniref:Aminoglycoside phosphotransferase domain-containing protein n=1 Tax=Candidatus Woesebacteria bacterium RIFCSPHIGHO2_01_FULL_39_28 TaxID=1802496 RepID=A0A1F7YEB0_9BACT|nr:MAG: hypothetical protein A2627_04455 [Candidatus Woesebacteria bacterium RIFCSPHIGHO2_01_FULL_39_28]OGM33421.1 MAG: hypothetical protein A3D00_02300 [Candidatus Woesebacteria bacterium RIFCSPHIGHO2_02_FULL_38_9]OGM57781.1 MAG: hypothetical protein A3A50_05720 [Candidatus Woesebacteria bacterium RIFCSPLOWO2_01_FULL_38_20]
MTSDTLQPSPTEVSPSPTDSWRNAVAASLNLRAQEIHLINAQQVLTGIGLRSRCLYGFTLPIAESLSNEDQRPPGFFKMSLTPELTELLKSESDITVLANNLGIPCVQILRPFQLTSGEFGILHLEQLNGEGGEFLATDEIIAQTDRSFGARAARAFIAISGKTIPKDVDSSCLRRDSARNESFETFMQVWEEKYNIIFSETDKGLDHALVGKFQNIVVEIRREIEPLIKKAVNPDVEYLVQNDTAPNNLFFRRDGKVLFLDLEHASATHNPFLAQLTDLANYYGRMWPNPEMQQEFLTTYLEFSTDSLESKYQLLKATAVFGSLYLASYGIKEGHKEHVMAESLLRNLENNLGILKQKYETMK